MRPSSIHIIALIRAFGRSRGRLVFRITTLLLATRVIRILLVYLERHTPKDGRLISSLADIRRWLTIPVPKKRDPERERLRKYGAQGIEV